MIVVADTSPLIVLSKIGEIQILPALFGEVLIPPDVKAELAAGSKDQAAHDLAARPPTWLVERTPSQPQKILGLDAGELAAISLALELNADFLLIDDIAGRKAAAQRQVRITGTIGVLEMAAGRRMLDLAGAFARVKQTNLWVPHDFLDERLKIFEQQTRGRK